MAAAGRAAGGNKQADSVGALMFNGGVEVPASPRSRPQTPQYASLQASSSRPGPASQQPAGDISHDLPPPPPAVPELYQLSDRPSTGGQRQTGDGQRLSGVFTVTDVTTNSVCDMADAKPVVPHDMTGAEELKGTELRRGPDTSQVPGASAGAKPPAPQALIDLPSANRAPPEPIDPQQADLGKGVFARVRMTHGRDGQIVAVKTYDHKEAKEERAVAKHMMNEERLAGKIQHENIIAPQLARKGRGCTELEMEYAPGGTLESHVKKLKRPLTEAEACKFFRQVVDAVIYLHGEGICHRDIKMENVVLDGDGNARLVDFGAAREGGADTFLHSVQGTPAYMAPEVAGQRAHKGAPADVWALGVLLYNLVSGGAFPFWGKNMDELRRNITSAPPRIPSHVSPACRELLISLLHKSSAARLSASDIRASKWVVQHEGPPPPHVGAKENAGLDSAQTADALPARPDEFAAAQAAVARYRAGYGCSKQEVEAARAAAASRLHTSQTAGAASPGRLGKCLNYAARSTSTAGPAGRPSSPGCATPKYMASGTTYGGGMNSPRSASKLAQLMSGNGRPGTPQGASRPGTARGGSTHTLGPGAGNRR